MGAARRCLSTEGAVLPKLGAPGGRKGPGGGAAPRRCLSTEWTFLPKLGAPTIQVSQISFVFIRAWRPVGRLPADRADDTPKPGPISWHVLGRRGREGPGSD